MRDLLVIGIVFLSLPLILWRPWIGVIMWCWIGFMNPHRLTWGIAFDFPFAQVVAVATLLGVAFSRGRKRIPLTGETVVLALFVSWMLLTTYFALRPSAAWEQWNKVWKIQLFIFLTMMLINTRERLQALVWVAALSLGFYGIKGGIFTVATGGDHRVWGPPMSFIDGNNEAGMAFLMTIPLMRYLVFTTKRRWMRQGLWGAIFLSGIAVLGTHSRGALVGLLFTGVYLIWKSRRRFFMVLALSVLVPFSISLMPAHWWERMDTIRTYKEDPSAMGRINAWGFAYNLAMERPLVGGGFEAFDKKMFLLYAPNPLDFHDAHSIYFEVLGEQGFVGLSLFLLILIFSWLSCSWVIRHGRGDPETAGLADLGRMLQVSLWSYAVSGAFLGLAYFDLYYNLVAMVVIAKRLVTERLLERASEVAEPQLVAEPMALVR